MGSERRSNSNVRGLWSVVCGSCRRLVFALTIALIFGATVDRVDARSCVWKVTGAKGETLYLAGSWHALRERDYPLPGAFKTAFDASSNLAFEISPNDLHISGKALESAATYPRGDSLKNHISPVTYSYLQVAYGTFTTAADPNFSRYRPWFLVLSLESPGVRGMSSKLGVERHFERRAAATSKPVTGLETLREHVEVFSGLNDRTSEALLLESLAPADNPNSTFAILMNAWHRGDADTLANVTRSTLRSLPGMADRLLSNRNRNWIPKIEGYLHSGKTYFVIAGAAHMGGTDGVLPLLKARGYKIEQL